MTAAPAGAAPTAEASVAPPARRALFPVITAPARAAPTGEASVAPPARRPLFPVITAPAGAAPTGEASVAPPARRPLFPVITVLAAALLAGCAGRAVPAATAPVGVDPAREAAAARAVAETFIAAEARGDEAADTLLAPGADFINSGIAVEARPRLAAVIGRGTAGIESLRTEVAGQLAWVVAVYRWTGQAGQLVGRGRATLVLERREAGWRIRHVHSSAVPPW